MKEFLKQFTATIVLPLTIIIGGILLARASTAAVEQKSQQTGDGSGIAEAPAAVVGPPVLGLTTRATVLRAIDGDTLEVELKHTVRVRLLDCWAPESKSDPRLPESDRSAAKARGLAARQHLRDLCEGREVILHVPTDGSGDLSRIWTLGRVLGQVWVVGENESLAEQQVDAGHAEVSKPEELR